MLNLHHLEVFHAVARAGSVSRGADALGISQPAVSKQLRQLERAMKTPLLDRHARGVRPTPAGAVLADHAARIFALAAAAELAVADVAGLRAGRLAVGAGPTAGVYLLPRAIVAFRQAHPDVRLSAETEGSDVLRQRLLDGLIDLAVTEAPLGPAPELSATVLLHDVLVPVAAATSPLAKRKSVKRDEFCREPFVARQTATGDPSLAERTLAARGLRVTPVLTVDSTEAIKQAVMAGVGVSLISRLAVATEVAAGRLARVNVRGLSVKHPVYHVRRRDRAPSPAATAFVRLLVASVMPADTSSASEPTSQIRPQLPSRR
jgi:DNA-binding transcriptional LysR family regulator